MHHGFQTQPYSVPAPAAWYKGSNGTSPRQPLPKPNLAAAWQQWLATGAKVPSELLPPAMRPRLTRAERNAKAIYLAQPKPDPVEQAILAKARALATEVEYNKFGQER